MKTPQPGAQLLGVHVEGPYFSLAQRGAQDPAHIRNPDDGSVEQLLEYRDTIRMLTFAPELPGALVLTQRLVALGIVAGRRPQFGTRRGRRACDRRRVAPYDPHVERAIDHDPPRAVA